MSTTPILEPRQAEEFARDLVAKVAGYVPGWKPVPGEPGAALLAIYARYLRALAERLNRAPEKNQLAFFDLIGMNLLPAQAAVAPLVFTPISHIVDARVPAGTQVAATVAGRDEPLIFETARTIALAGASLVEVATLWPGVDGWADHTAEVLGGQPFDLFTKMKQTPHEFYIAHDTHLALAGRATVEVQFELSRPGSEPLELAWEYWDGEVWREFKTFAAPAAAGEDESLDGTAGLTRSGIVRLAADCAATKRRRINGVLGSWIRARALQALPPTPGRILPLADRIGLRTTLAVTGLDAEAAFVDGLKLDTSKTFYPLGQQPQPGTTFWLMAGEAVSRPGAVVTIDASPAVTPQGPYTDTDSATLAAECWDGRNWKALDLDSDALNRFLLKGEAIEFTVPAGITATTVNGVAGNWIRVRITDGGFFKQNTITWKQGKVSNSITVTETVPPAIQGFAISYTYASELDAPMAAFSYNDFQWTDRGGAVRWRGDAFEPFSLLSDRTPAIYLGFDRPLPADFLGLYVDVDELDPSRAAPLLRWEHFDGREWLGAAADDETGNLARPGMLGLACPGSRSLPTAEAVVGVGTEVQVANARQAAGFQPGDLVLIGEGEKGELASLKAIVRDTLVLSAPLEKSVQRVPVAVAMLPRFGRPRSWLRARLQPGTDPLPARVNGLYFNAVRGEQLRRAQQETLGSSDGAASQVFFARHTPVLPGEVVEVRELLGARTPVELPILQDELEREGIPADALRTVADPRSGRLTEAWVRWESRPTLLFSGPGERHYTIERSRGRLIFGDGVHGRVPPMGGDAIRLASYSSGGGAIGNVGKGAITQLLSGVPASAVTNVRAAEGGADGETVEAVPTRAPAAIRHRGQALSLADYEALARQASPAVAVARALPVTHASGRRESGHVRVIVQPHSLDPRPQPSFGLRRQVLLYLQARLPASMGGQVSVSGPEYLPVGCGARIAPLELSRAGEVHDAVRARLAAFFHPGTGGPEGAGWPFGRSVHLSDVASVIEAVAGVDYVESLVLMLEATPVGETVPVPTDRIVVAGEIRVTIIGGEA